MDARVMWSESQKITSSGEDVEKFEPSRTTGGNRKWFSHSGTLSGSSSKG